MTSNIKWFPGLHCSWSFEIKTLYSLCTLTSKNWSLAKTLGLTRDITGSLSSMQVNSRVFINNPLGPAWLYRHLSNYCTLRKVWLLLIIGAADQIPVTPLNSLSFETPVAHPHRVHDLKLKTKQTESVFIFTSCNPNSFMIYFTSGSKWRSIAV